MNELIALLIRVLIFEEGFRSKAYYCSEGYPTIGIGWRIGPKGAPLDAYDFRVNRTLAETVLNSQLVDLIAELKKLEWFNELNTHRQVAIASMAFQMGISGVLQFKRMIKAIKKQDWKKAEAEALDSKWASQTPNRARRHSRMIELGSTRLVYGAKLD